MDIDLFNIFARQHEVEAAKRELAATNLALGQVPTDPLTRKVINQSVGIERELLLSHHKFDRERKLRRGFDALVTTAGAAYIDILKLEATIAAHSDNAKNDGLMNYVVSDQIQKEVIAFCAAIYGIVDITRRMKTARPDLATAFDRLKVDLQNSKHPCFLFDMRKNLSHGSVILPTWTVTTSLGVSRGGIIMHVPILLNYGDWSAETKKYLSSQINEEIDLRLEIEQYLTALNTYAVSVRSLFLTNATDAEHDYYDIEDSYNRRNRTQFLRMMMGQIKNRKDPLNYLDSYFTAEEARAIKRLPYSSKEQIDFIIALKSAQYDANDDLRREIYDLFASIKPQDK